LRLLSRSKLRWVTPISVSPSKILPSSMTSVPNRVALNSMR
jgi:hypothetical protein